MGATSPIEAIQTLGKYTLLEKLGEGYLGSVFRGFDQNLGQAVAIRVLCDGIKWDPKIEEAYNCQCQSVEGLKHAAIASVLDFGKERQFHYIAMESLGNSTLTNLIARKPVMAVEAKLSIMIQVAEGMSYAHKKGILHRDLGPAKIHLTADGTAKIRDFAIASVLMKHLPHPWIRFGTPIYLSPEQIQQKNCDQRSDIFSAGTIFYELLTYLHPFHDRDSNKALDNILQDTQIPTFDLFPDEPPGIWPILKACLARNPNDRFQNMDEFSSACRDLLKDLAEDSRLMLAELYAVLTPLRKAAAKPDAPESAIALLQDIQKLVRGEKEADYASLDRLMNVLIEQYPAVQAIAGSLPALGTEIPPDGANGKILENQGLSPFHSPVEIQDPSPIELALKKVLRSDSPELSTMPPGNPPAALSERMEREDNNGHSEIPLAEIWDPTSDMQFAFETSFIKPEEDQVFAPEPYQAQAPLEQPSLTIHASGISEPLMDPAGRSQTPPDERPDSESGMQYPEIHCAELADASPKPQALPEIPFAKHEEEKTPDDKGSSDTVALSVKTNQDSSVETKPAAKKKTGPATSYRRIRRRSYRTTVVLLSLLLIAAAAYIVWGTDFAASLNGALKERMPVSSVMANAFARFDGQKSPNVPAAAGTEISKASAGFQSTVPATMEHQQISSVETTGSAVNQPPQDRIFQISRLISSGKLQLAKAALDKLQRTYPTAPQIFPLRRQWEAKNSAAAQELTRKEQEQLSAAIKQREDEWNRRLASLMGHGQYGEANSALNLWLVEDPGSPRAREFGAKIGEIQRNLNMYASAMAENNYPDALNALSVAERLNPADANFVELHRQIEARKAAAKAFLTIHRLGTKATLLLDGHHFGNDGEIDNEPIPIGNHTLSIESGGNQIASKRQEFFEGQRFALVYDLARQQLRTMVDTDRELLAQRKTMEEVRYFDVEHGHGTFRGSCRGLLMIDYLDVAFRPSAGFHGFRIPFKLLKVEVNGRTIDLINISDNKNFQSFKLHDEQVAEKFQRSWDELKSLARQ